jgi:hypothetical protein
MYLRTEERFEGVCGLHGCMAFQVLCQIWKLKIHYAASGARWGISGVNAIFEFTARQNTLFSPYKVFSSGRNYLRELQTLLGDPSDPCFILLVYQSYVSDFEFYRIF